MLDTLVYLTRNVRGVETKTPISLREHSVGIQMASLGTEESIVPRTVVTLPDW